MKILCLYIGSDEVVRLGRVNVEVKRDGVERTLLVVADESRTLDLSSEVGLLSELVSAVKTARRWASFTLRSEDIDIQGLYIGAEVVAGVCLAARKVRPGPEGVLSLVEVPPLKASPFSCPEGRASLSRAPPC